MALSKQPEIASVPITRIPDDNPNANISKGINSSNPKLMVAHPIMISVLPTFISIRQLNCVEVFTQNPYIYLATIFDGKLYK
jgi:hypothetical protein